MRPMVRGAMVRTCGVALIIFAVLARAPLSGQTTQPTFTAGDRTDVEAVVRGYFAAFTAKDYTSFGKYFQAPFVSFGREPVIVATLDEVITRYRGIRDPLDQADYSESNVAEVRVTGVTFERALANIHWRRLKIGRS